MLLLEVIFQGIYIFGVIVMQGWIHFIDSKESYEELWKTIIKYRELYIGRYIIIDGYLTTKDGRVFGREGEILAGIITITLKEGVMENMIREGIIDTERTVLIKDLSPEDILIYDEGGIEIKKEKKDFEDPSSFKNYLRKIHFKDFK